MPHQDFVPRHLFELEQPPEPKYYLICSSLAFLPPVLSTHSVQDHFQNLDHSHHLTNLLFFFSSSSISFSSFSSSVVSSGSDT